MLKKTAKAFIVSVFNSERSLNFSSEKLYNYFELVAPPPALLTWAVAIISLVLVPQMCFCFVGLPLFPSASWPLSFPLSFSSLPPTLLDSCANAWLGQGFCAWTHFLAFMEWADDIGSGPAAWSYVPVRSSSCSLPVFYRTLVVGKDAYQTPLMIIIIILNWWISFAFLIVRCLCASCSANFHSISQISMNNLLIITSE